MAGSLAFLAAFAVACGGSGAITPGASTETPSVQNGPQSPTAVIATTPLPVTRPEPESTDSPDKRVASAAASVEFDTDTFAGLAPGGPRDVNPGRFRQLLDRDAIVPIYEPRIVSADGAGLADDELVMGVALNGEARAYPISMMRSREIANDEVGGVPILVTW